MSILGSTKDPSWPLHYRFILQLLTSLGWRVMSNYLWIYTDSQLGLQVQTLSLSPEWGLWKQDVALLYCLLVDRRTHKNVQQDFRASSRMNCSSTNHVPSSPKKKSESFHSPTEGMTATSVNTASIHVCLFKKALSSATGPKGALVGLSTTARLSFIYQRDHTHSRKSQESKVSVFTFQQLNPTGRVKCK